jgi:hypothetical protein
MSSINLKNKSATHIVAATMGVLVGLAGVEHGFFEILQGNLRPNGILIQAIGPAQRYWEHGTETALTVLPSYLMSGILSILLGVLVILWSILFIDRRHGAGVLLLLCILLFLTGGGFAPIFMAVLASLAATQIGKPMKFWSRLPEGLLRLLARIWLVSLIALVILFLISVEIAIFGWPLTVLLDDTSSLRMLYDLSYGMIGLMLLSIISGFAFDIQQQSGTKYGRHIQSQVQG